MSERKILSELIEWTDDWTGASFFSQFRKKGEFRLTDDQIKKRENYLKSLNPIYLAQCSRMLQDVNREREFLIKYQASPYEDMISLTNEVAGVFNIETMLQLTQDGGRDPFDSRHRFEAVQLFDIAVTMAHIEQYKAMDNLGRDHKENFAQIEQKLFRGQAKKITIWTHHDPKDFFRVNHEPKINKRLRRDAQNVRRHDVKCRILKNGEYVLVHHRLKGPWRTYLKLLLQKRYHRENPHRDTLLVSDRCGDKYIVRTPQLAYKLAQQIRKIFLELGADLSDVQGNISLDRTVDPDNPHTSSLFKALKFDACLNNQSYENQIMTFRDYFSSHFALNDENHRIYKLNQAISVFLPMLFPSCIHEVSWGNTGVKKRLRQYTIDQIGWSVIH